MPLNSFKGKLFAVDKLGASGRCGREESENDYTSKGGMLTFYLLALSYKVF